MLQFLFYSLVLSLSLFPLHAFSSCDVNCSAPSTLAGWSKDGKIWATIQDCDEIPDIRTGRKIVDPSDMVVQNKVFCFKDVCEERVDVERSVMVIQNAQKILHLVRTKNCTPKGFNIKRLSLTELETKEGEKISTTVIPSDPQISPEAQSPIERMDVSTDKALLKYHLQPVQTAWKEAFANQFFLRPREQHMTYFHRGKHVILPTKQTYPTWMVEWISSGLKQFPQDELNALREKNPTITCLALTLSSQKRSLVLLESCKNPNPPYDYEAEQIFSFAGGFLHPSGAILLKFSYRAVGLSRGTLFSYLPPQ